MGRKLVILYDLDSMVTTQSVLITVGTTGFDDLIRMVCSEPFARELVHFGYQSIYIQYGSSEKYYSDNYLKQYNIRVEAFPYCPSLAPYFAKVNLVIGHAGAGTILDTLRSKVPLLVVVNESLMGNHQHEIADAMVEGGYLIKATPETLIESLYQFRLSQLREYPEAQPENFVSYLNREMHFNYN